MSLSRRQFLVALLALPLSPRLGLADPILRTATYRADIGVLFNFFTFTLDGRVEEQVDRISGRYQVLVAGEGPGIANRIESAGLIRERRLAPTTTSLFFRVGGRESRTHVSYDYGRGLAHYHHASQTFLLGRWRRGADVIEIPVGQPLDDIVTATLNYGEGLLEGDGEGAFRTFMIRRARLKREGLDEVQAEGYRAEIVPVRFTPTQDSPGGQPVCLLDLTRYSSWAIPGNPVRVTFGPSRRPESIHVSLMLGTTVRITFQGSP